MSIKFEEERLEGAQEVVFRVTVPAHRAVALRQVLEGLERWESAGAFRAPPKRTPGERLREHRLRRNLKQSDVARAVGCVQARISNYEHGTRPIPHELAGEFARFFDCDEDEFVG